MHRQASSSGLEHELDEFWAAILVEGESDQNAIAALAARMDRDLSAEGIQLISMGGAHAIRRYLAKYGPQGKDLKLAGLYDVGEERIIAQALRQSGVLDRAPTSRSMIETVGFFVCVQDLEDELIRALGPENVEAVLASQGDLHSFRTLQKQPEWRGKRSADQLHRFMGSGATRKTRYASLLVEAVDPEDIPRPLLSVLDYLSSARR